MVNDNDKQAIGTYLEFQLMKLIEKYERHIPADAIHSFYDDAYAIVADLEKTLDTQIEIQDAVERNSKK